MADVKPVFSRSQGRFLVHLGTRMAPGIAELDWRGRKRLRMIVRLMLQRRSGAERFQIRLFLYAVKWAPAIVFFRPFERIPEGAQDWILLRLEAFPIKMVRAGFWGIKTLVFMGYYGQPQIARRLHYTPDLRRGNELLKTGEPSRT